jgi:hypothetical protein
MARSFAEKRAGQRTGGVNSQLPISNSPTIPDAKRPNPKDSQARRELEVYGNA